MWARSALVTLVGVWIVLSGGVPSNREARGDTGTPIAAVAGTHDVDPPSDPPRTTSKPDGGSRSPLESRGMTLGTNPQEVSRLRAYTLQKPVFGPSAVASAADGSTTISLALDGTQHIVRLRPDSLRAPGFTVYVQREDGAVTKSEPPPSTLLRGTVDGDPASDVVATLSDRGLSLRARLSNGDTWIAQPAAAVHLAATDDTYVVYRDIDVESGEEGCSAHDEPYVAAKQKRPRFRKANNGDVTASDPAAAVTMKVAEIAFDVDYEYFVLNHSSIDETVLDVEDILARVTQIYEAEAGITFELTAVVIRTTAADPYFAPDAAGLLAEFAAEWNANMAHVPRDTAHLMTGKQLSNNVIGTARIDVMCDVCGNAEGYGLSRSRYSEVIELRTSVTAHEIGHNWGAQHCDADEDCGIMCSQVGLCSGDLVHFGQTPLAAIEATRDEAECLGTMPGALDLPFCDDFNGILDPRKWPYAGETTITGGGMNPPSEPTSLLLNNCCSGCSNTPWPDDLRSNYIRLGGVSKVTLAYHTEFRGTSATAGSQLVVEYLAADGFWKELNRVTADGTSQSSFRMWTHLLPADAKHDRFRLRIHLAGSTPHADWYVDDLTLSSVDPDSPILYVHSNAPAGGTGESWASAFRDLQDALGAAECSFGLVEEIWVTAGTFKPDRSTGDREATFRMVDGVALYGGFRGGEWHREDRDPAANASILSGEIGNPNSRLDNSYHVVTASGTGPTTVLDGFVVTRGQADAALSPDNAGGGLINVAGSPTIARCRFQENRARRGAGMYHTLGAAPTISDAVFVTNFTLSGDGDPNLSSGGGVLAELGSYLTLDRVRWIANVAQGGGGGLGLSESSAEIRNSLFAVNVAQTGGATFSSNAGITLANCTFSGNFASLSGGGVADDGGVVSLNNSILWGNLDASGGGQAAQVSAAKPSVNHSIVQGLTGVWGGEGNLALDPQFRDPNGADNAVGTLDDDLRLLATSPAIDAGDPMFNAGSGALDLDGFPRILRGRVDIGAHEFGMVDFDMDRAVERSDAAEFPTCLSGPLLGYPAPCRIFDFDADGNLDLFDFAKTMRYLSGATLNP